MGGVRGLAPAKSGRELYIDDTSRGMRGRLHGWPSVLSDMTELIDNQVPLDLLANYLSAKAKSHTLDIAPPGE